MFRHKSEDQHAGDERCGIHQFDRAAGRCRACGGTYCEGCLIYPHGARRQPYCVRCALVAAGIRRPDRSRLRVG